MANSFRYVTAPEKRYLPRTALGWIGLIAAVIVIAPVIYTFAGIAIWSLLNPEEEAASQTGAEARVEPEREATAASESESALRREEQEARDLAERAKQSRQRAVAEVQYDAARETLDALRQTLRDPYSVRFRDVWVMGITYEGIEGGSAVCGVFNARNAYGGYTGETSFVGVGRLVWVPGDMRFPEYYRDFCQNGERKFQVHVTG